MEFKNKLVIVALSAALLSTSATFAAQSPAPVAGRQLMVVPQPEPTVSLVQKLKAKLPAMPTVTGRTMRRTGAVGLSLMAAATLATSTVPGADAASLQAIAATELALAGAIAHEDTVAGLGHVKTALLKIWARIMNYPMLANTAAAGGHPVGELPVDQAAIDREVANRVARNADIPAMLDADDAARLRVPADNMVIPMGDGPLVINLAPAPAVVPAGWMLPDDAAPAVAKRKGRSKTRVATRIQPGRAARKDS